MTENSVEETPEAEAEAPAAPEQPLPDDFANALADAIVASTVDGASINLAVKPETIAEVVSWLLHREAGPYQHLASLCGIDHGDDLGVVYHLYQLGRPARVVIHVRLPRSEPKLPSIAAIMPAANWKEREAMELFGIEFEGHPDPRKLLLPEDWGGYPLRKDYG